jgi:hypothetical protein
MESDKVSVTTLERNVPYPDGRIGFYFVRMRYTEDAEAIFEEELEERKKPITDEVILDGELIEIQHPLLDMGEVENLFDGDTFTMVRTFQANPVLIILTFPQPRLMNGVSITTGTMDIILNVRLFDVEKGESITYSQAYTHLPNDPTVDLPFSDGSVMASTIVIDLLGLFEDPESKVHIREITLY